MSKALDKTFDEPTEKMRETRQRSAGLERDARQPRLAMVADVKPDAKTRKRMENVAADRVISGISSFAQVYPDPMCLTSFNDESTGPPAIPRSRDDALVDKGAATPKLCLLPMGMRTLTGTGRLLSVRTASTAVRTIFPRPLFFLSVGETKKCTSRTNNQLAPSVDGGLFKLNQGKL